MVWRGAVMRRFLAILAVCAVALAPVTAEAAETVVVSAAQARAAALQAVREGRTEVAEALSSALLARDEGDAAALLVRALLRRDAGRLEEARAASAAAWRNAEAPALRFDAAFLTADILARQERLTRAQIWLRRADQAAPDPARRQLAAGAYQAVARRNPLQVSLRFGLKPSNNVNNGAETLTIDIGGLPFVLDDSGQQLGGWEASAGVSLGFRLSESRTHRTDAIADVFYRRVWLDDTAAATAPGVRGSDFDYGAVVGGIRHQRLIWAGLGPSSVTGIVGQSWYGGDALARWGEIQLGQIVRQGEDSAFHFGLQARIEKRLDDSVNDARSVALIGEYVRSLGGEGRYSLGASLRSVWSDAATVDNLALGLNASRSFGRIGSVEPRIGLAAEARDFRKWVATPGGRQDRTVSLSLDLRWPEVSYYGFVPQATLSARKTWSDVDIYDRNEVSLGLTAVSRF